MKWISQDEATRDRLSDENRVYRLLTDMNASSSGDPTGKKWGSESVR